MRHDDDHRERHHHHDHGHHNEQADEREREQELDGDHHDDRDDDDGNDTTTLKAEKQTDPVEERDRAKEALIELFKEAKTKNTHIIVERIVAQIEDIVKKSDSPAEKYIPGRARGATNAGWLTDQDLCSTKPTATSENIIERRATSFHQSIRILQFKICPPP
jgi:hypothetical protein